MLTNILKYSSLILLIIIVVSVGLLSSFLVSAQSQVGEFDFAGWIWSENYGWISFNSDNCLLLDPLDCIATDPRTEYSVKIDSGNEITGYAWSEGAGWVCFGDGGGDNTKGCVGTPPSGSLTTTMDEASGKITGWAQVIGMGDNGWLKIGRGSAQGANFGEDCYDCQPVCDQWTIEMQGDPPEPVEVPPCIIFSETEFDGCTTCFTRTNFDGINIPDPGVDSVVNGSGYICSDCLDCRKVNGVVEGTSRMVCNNEDGASGQCNSCELYGINRNIDDGAIVGWGWSGDSVSGLEGAGWVHFNTEYSTGYIVFPWLQTIYGSIYTPGDVRQKAGSEGRNATYCIFANDINTNIKTQNCEDIASGLVKDVDTGFPTKSPARDVYRNALGKIDIDGLLDKVVASGTRNKYGHIVNEIADASWIGPIGPTTALDNSVYYFDGDLIIPAVGVTFDNGSGGKLGNGIVIVKGDLIINGDIFYDSNNPASLNELASIAWIVKGDVILDPDAVEVISGAFIILGDGNETCELASAGDYARYNINGCGALFTGDSENPLTILGMVVARAFDLGRTFTEILQGSERIIYDGRIAANPPPGMEGFVEGLPVIRDFSY